MTRRFALATLSLAVLVVAAGTRPLPASPLPPRLQQTDWPTYGFDVQRSGSNPTETLLGPGTVGRLHLLWRTSLGGATITSPTVAARVSADGSERMLVFVGTEHGDLDAIDAADGRVVWRDHLGSVKTTCYDMPGDTFGVSGTPVIDRSAGRLYVAASDGAHDRVGVYALDLATGRVAPGWPVSVSGDPRHMNVWGALTLWRGTLYVTLASLCDFAPSYGRVVAVDAASARIRDTWYVVHRRGAVVGGGGIWGYGGASVDPATGAVFVATGNALPPGPEDQPFGERVVRLSPDLRVIQSNHPPLAGRDVDFGSTPVLLRAPGCPPQLVVENKSGALLVYAQGQIAAGPVQRLQVGANASRDGLGIFIGLPAYSPADGLLVVSNPGPDDPPFTHGVIAFRVGTDCAPSLAWQRALGPDGTTTVPSPTVTNGVVYAADGAGGRVFALDATDGRPLWDSGRTLGGAVFAPPVVVDGRLFVAAWDGGAGGDLYAFGP